MYSVVLMMALSGGGNAATADAALVNPVAKYGDNGHKQERLFGGRRCHGGGERCHGGGYGGCHGGGYGGCCGGGGYAGCCGGGAYGAYGYGGGGYYGAMPYATGYYRSMPYSSGFYGTPIYGTPGTSGFQPAGPAYEYGAPGNPNNTERFAPPSTRGSLNAATPATLVVRLPADAQLTIEGAPTRATQGVRTFTSPPLQPGKEYQYTIKAQVKRNGKTVERTRDVTVRAGLESDVTIDLPAPDQSP